MISAVGFVFQTLWFVKPYRTWLPFMGCSAETQSKRCPSRVAQQSNTTEATRVTGEREHPRQKLLLCQPQPSFGSYPAGESVRGILETHNTVSVTSGKSVFLPGSPLQSKFLLAYQGAAQSSQPFLRLHPNSILPLAHRRLRERKEDPESLMGSLWMHRVTQKRTIQYLKSY